MAATRIGGAPGHLIVERDRDRTFPTTIEQDGEAVWGFFWEHITLRTVGRHFVRKYIEHFPEWAREDMEAYEREQREAIRRRGDR